MANELSINSLLNKFGIPEKGDWINMAIKETSLSDPLSQLSWRATDKLSFLPIYDRYDTEVIPYDDAFALPPSIEEFRPARFWLNVPPVTVAEPSAANSKALDHLANGADGIFFSSIADLSRQLYGIDLAACTVSFPVNGDNDIDALREFADTREGQLNVNLLWESTPLRTHAILKSLGKMRGIRALGLAVDPGDAVMEIAETLIQAVKLIDELTDAGLAPNDIFPHVHFVVTASSDYFLTLAKLKVIRLLWYQVVRTYGADIAYHEIFIHARCPAVEEKDYEPRGSLIRNTVASIAAACGGCNALTVDSDKPENASADRIARNISAILAYEAHVDKVADPFAGSYFVEKLVYDLADAAWKIFQAKSTTA